jgi:hypothetical protein
MPKQAIEVAARYADRHGQYRLMCHSTAAKSDFPKYLPWCNDSLETRSEIKERLANNAGRIGEYTILW